ncbi:MAG: universal stress protein [Vicinamibacterales bacterium]
MPPFTSVLCALDFSDLAPRVLKHAAGIAGACGARLTVLAAVGGDTHAAEATLKGLLGDALPADAGYLGEPRVRVVRITQGQPADAILEMAREGTDLIVTGTHGKSGVSRWLLGSTSAMVLELTKTPTLLVPPGNGDIVTLTASEVKLHPGTVLVPVDLTEHNQAQLELGSQMAALARQPLVVMTVTGGGASDTDAEQSLRKRVAGLGPAPADRVLVRRGASVAEEIDHVAVAEHSGLVVMGLREPGHGVPGEIASAVLKTKDAIVLAVPSRT